MKTFQQFANKKILLVGDLMLSRRIEERVNGSTFEQIFHERADYLKGFSTIVSNFEQPIMEGEITPDDSVIFRTSAEVFKELIQTFPFNVFNLANNHIMNQGVAGFINTKRIMEKHNTKWFNSKPAYVDDLCFTGFNRVSGRGKQGDKIIQIDSEAKIIDTVSKLSNEYFNVVYFHYGEEYHMTHNREQERLSRMVVDAGADLVIGTHPHVVQDFEIYQNKYIFYSLGNFLFDQENPATHRGLVVELTHDKKISTVHWSVPL